jgi:hypothetical protein
MRDIRWHAPVVAPLRCVSTECRRTSGIIYGSVVRETDAFRARTPPWRAEINEKFSGFS